MASPQATVRQASQEDSALFSGRECSFPGRQPPSFPGRQRSFKGRAAQLPRQATPRLPQQTALSPRQRAQFPRQATPKLPQRIALSPRQRVKSPKASNPQAAPVVRHSAGLRALHASQNNNSQAGSPQAGNTPWQTALSLSQIVRPPSWALPRSGASQVTSSH